MPRRHWLHPENLPILIKRAPFILLIIACLLANTVMATPTAYSELKQSLGTSLVFISKADHPDLFLDAESIQHLHKYHNQYLREPMYDDYVYLSLKTLLGEAGFQHLFKNLGGGFVPIKVINNELIMKGTQDHCGGLEEGLIVIDLIQGHITAAIYSSQSFTVYSTLSEPQQLSSPAIRWIKRLLNSNGTTANPSRNYQLLRKMAGSWCKGS